jgi:hypothetical protein
MTLTKGKLAQLLSLAGLLASIGSSPGLSLDGRSLPADNLLQRTVVSVGGCTRAGRGVAGLGLRSVVRIGSQPSCMEVQIAGNLRVKSALRPFCDS